jgi:hypothetical protein
MGNCQNEAFTDERPGSVWSSEIRLLVVADIVTGK